jgi:hypothetical protein
MYHGPLVEHSVPQLGTKLGEIAMRADQCRLFLLAVALTAFVPCLLAQEPTTKTKKKAKTNAQPVQLDPFDRPEGSIHDQTARYYVWYDKEGWHLRATAKGARMFSGVIRLKEAKIKSCVPIGLSDGKQGGHIDAVKFNDARNELKFSFRTGNLSDGFDLVVDGEEGQIEFELSIDTKKAPKAIFIGRGRQNPDTNPVTLPAMPKRSMR